jgi:DNA primase
VRILKRYAGHAVVNFDPDEAGANAAEKSIQLLLDEGFRVRVATLEGGLDPDEYVRANGAEAYRQRLEQAPNYFHWLAQRARQKFDVRTSEGKVEALEHLLPAVRRLGDRVERAALAGEMAAVLGIEQGLLLEQFRRAASSQKPERITAPAMAVPPVERLLLELVLHSAEVRGHVLGQLEQYPLLRRSAAAEIWAALGELGAEGFQWARLEGKLSPAAKSLMETVAFADHIHTDQNLVEQANACLAQLDADHKRAHVGEWKKRIREAEQRGDLSAALAMAAELHEWERSGR